MTNYKVTIGQVLLPDFTVVRLVLSAVLIGMIGIDRMNTAGLAILGFCPGTAAGAAGTGALDPVIGIVLGAGIIARLYPRLDRLILNHGLFPALDSRRSRSRSAPGRKL